MPAARVMSVMCVAVSAPGSVLVHNVVSLWGQTYSVTTASLAYIVHCQR